MAFAGMVIYGGAPGIIFLLYIILIQYIRNNIKLKLSYGKCNLLTFTCKTVLIIIQMNITVLF